ncbi:hypothetical protein FOZ62_018827, partial [Perkinsus olseni]
TAVFNKVDAIVMPTLPLTSIPITEDFKAHGISDSPLFVKMMRYIWPTNFLGFPSITVPVGYDAQGMPIGLLVSSRLHVAEIAIRSKCYFRGEETTGMSSFPR